MTRIVPRFDFRIEHASSSEVGLVRASNEDRVRVDPDHAVFAIADGMGGHAAGEVAAELALEAVVGAMAQPFAASTLGAFASDPSLQNRHAVFELLRSACDAANATVLAASRANETHRGMGTTLDLCVLARNRAFFAHVGDGRAYLVRPSTAVQLTHDHTAYDTLRAQGSRPPNSRPARNPLVNAIGLAEAVQVDTLHVDLARGDRVLLCTDGVHGAFEHEGVLMTLCTKGSPEEICNALVRYAASRGGRDNASAVVVHVCEPFVKRASDDGMRAGDLATLVTSPLLLDMPPSAVLGALAAGVEIDVPVGHSIAREIASDRVAYIVLDGLVHFPDGRTLGAPALLFAESLVGIARDGPLPTVSQHARLIRIRHDDFREVCEHDADLAAALLLRLAHHLARGAHL